MTTTGAGLAHEVGFRQGQFRCFQDFAFDSLLPVFSGIHDQNDKDIAEITQRHWKEASDESGYVSYEDGGEILEGADDARSLLYEATNSIRQSMLNLLAAGMFHLAEQLLVSIILYSGAEIKPSEAHFKEIRKCYRKLFGPRSSDLPGWELVDRLRHVANTVKHGDGLSARELQKVRPDMFQHPRSSEDYPEDICAQDAGERADSESRVSLPLAGADLFVSEEDLKAFGDACLSLFQEIEEYFSLHKDDNYPLTQVPKR